MLKNKDDHAYFNDLYTKYFWIMRKKAYHILTDYDIAEDIVQDAFINLIGKIDLLRSFGAKKEITYILQTVQNVSLNYVNQRKRRNSKIITGNDNFIESIADKQPSLEELYNYKEDLDEIVKIINGLSERDRDLLYNKYIMEMRDKEIADLLNVKKENIRSYLTRAKRRAIKLFVKEGRQFK
ncbi:DNA-directed RNA polymerase sigma-70 factor [Paenibacillus chitinolyticus]|uniref:RNA polymerase sigma factor n=1 Tax=Paenibacillus chitinolyticus TaxID=79263 RepID=UPI0026E4B306|nr:RNA polymerase sigma factor [Paenibacillus chitinolyticus]GKS10923.1 DNA-directed RNA polymerase sigma-70 factor [Paenibacillus chitinolyticus]